MNQFIKTEREQVKINEKSAEIQHENVRLAEGWRNRMKTHVAVGGSTEVVGICLLDRQLPLAGTSGTAASWCSLRFFVLPLMYTHTHPHMEKPSLLFKKQHEIQSVRHLKVI